MSASHQADVTADLDSTTTDSLCVGVVGWGVLGVIIESNLNRVRLSCCWVGVGLGCDNVVTAGALLWSVATHRLYSPPLIE